MLALFFSASCLERCRSSCSSFWYDILPPVCRQYFGQVSSFHRLPRWWLNYEILLRCWLDCKIFASLLTWLQDICFAAIFIARIFTLMESLLCDIRLRPGKETRDNFQDRKAAIKAMRSPLAVWTLLIKHSELLNVQDRRTGRLCVLVISGVFSQTLFHKDWVYVRVGVCVLVIEGSRTAED